MFHKCSGIIMYLLLGAVILTAMGCGFISIALPETEQRVPTYATTDPNTSIFFKVLDQAEDTVQIWQRDIDGTIQYSLLELPTQYPATGLPIQELALLKREYCSGQQSDCSVEDLSLSFGLGGLRISPNKQWLAWSEEASWCPGTQCYGVGGFIVWNIIRGERQVLLELPAHIERFATNTIDNMIWSPDSKEIGFVHSSDGNGWSRIRVIDVETKQIRDLGDGQGSITWSPDGEQLAFFAEKKVKIISREGTTQTILDGGWMETNSLDWSPDGSKLAITASTTPILQDYRFSLFIADLTTGDIVEVKVDSDEQLSYTTPHWSPDGKLIGVNTRPNEKEIVNGLTLLDPDNGTIRENLILERQQPEWWWSAAGDVILINLPSAEKIGIFYWQEDRLEEISPPPSLKEGLENGEIYLSEPVW